MTILRKSRKSSVLTPSQLRCLSKIPTINITSGCIHSCIYCYTKGYSQYPGDGRVILFTSIADKLSSELAKKRNKPIAVYFCPSCDPFQPDSRILDQSFKVMEMLLRKGVGVQFVTKANIPANFIDLFAKSNRLVCAQIGLTTTDDKIRKIFEPNAASVSDRMSSIRKLVTVGVQASVRADPLIYGVTDSDESLANLFSSISRIGIDEVAISYLFLRPSIRKSIEKNISDNELLRKLFMPYSGGVTVPIGMKNSCGVVLPKEVRESAFARIKKIAAKFGIVINICGCKNPDITTQYCNITRLRPLTESSLFAGES